MVTPQTEHWFAWREFTTPDGELAPRLIVPVGDLDEHELQDMMFDSVESAQKWKAEVAPYDEWLLCKVIIEPVVGWKQCFSCNEVKLHTVGGEVCMNCMERTNGRRESEQPEDEAGQVRSGGTEGELSG